MVNYLLTLIVEYDNLIIRGTNEDSSYKRYTRQKF